MTAALAHLDLDWKQCHVAIPAPQQGHKGFWRFRHGINMSRGFSLALRSRQQLLLCFKRQEHYAACQSIRASPLQQLHFFAGTRSMVTAYRLIEPEPCRVQ